MGGVIWWVLIAEGLAVALASRWLTIRHSAKPCLLCGKPARHRAPRLSLHPNPLCCEHMNAFAHMPKRRSRPAGYRPRPARLRRMHLAHHAK